MARAGSSPRQRVYRIARFGAIVAAATLLSGCELLAFLIDEPPPQRTMESTAHAVPYPAPMPPPPRPRAASRLGLAASPKPPNVMPAAGPVPAAPAMPPRPRVPVASEPAPPVPVPAPAPAAADPPPVVRAAPPPAVEPSPRPAPRVDIDPASLVGRSEAQLELALGKPQRHERIASGVNWIYDRSDCLASFLLLPEVSSGERRVFAYEITPRGGEAPTQAACLGRIAADGRSRRS